MSRSQNGNGRLPEPLILKNLSPRGLYIPPKRRVLCEPLELLPSTSRVACFAFFEARATW